MRRGAGPGLAIGAAAILSASFALPAAAQKPEAVAPAVRDAWFGPDKVKHFFIAGFVEAVSFGVLEAAGADRNTALPASLSAAAVVSVGREVHDRRVKGLFSIKDLTFDVLGAAAAFLLLRHTQR